MADITAPIVDGSIVTNTSETYQTKKSKGDALGKDAFLQLLVAQMQHQDPLEPADNSKMITELAQFTTIEELQNLGARFENNAAFGLVGKNVIIEVGKSTESTTTTTVGGYVEYVQIVDGKAMLSIGGEMYDYADLDMVIDDAYLDSIINGGNNTDKDDTTDAPSDEETDSDNTEDSAEV